MDEADAELGSQRPAMWNEVEDNDRKAGLISATRPVEDYFTSRFEAQANDFDAEAVHCQAKSFIDAMIRYPSPGAPRPSGICARFWSRALSR